MGEEEHLVSESATCSTDLDRRIQEELGQNVYLYYQCVKWTGGCPVAKFFEGPLVVGD